MPRTALGLLIAERRRRMHLTQAELAQAIGVERATLASIESGKTRQPPAETINRIARVLGNVTVAELARGMGLEIEADQLALQRQDAETIRLLRAALERLTGRSLDHEAPASRTASAARTTRSQ